MFIKLDSGRSALDELAEYALAGAGRGLRARTATGCGPYEAAWRR